MTLHRKLALSAIAIVAAVVLHTSLCEWVGPPYYYYVGEKEILRGRLLVQPVTLPAAILLGVVVPIGLLLVALVLLVGCPNRLRWKKVLTTILGRPRS